jgi:hypothetical protein
MTRRANLCGSQLDLHLAGDAEFEVKFIKAISAAFPDNDDGRARSLEEAILWHGGEAEVAKESFRTMSQSDRNALTAFLESL